MKIRSSRGSRAMLLGAMGAALLLSIGLANTASAAPLAHGHTAHILKPRLNANQSSNWFGYNQGTLEQGGLKQFHSISGDWTVPAARNHTAGQDEYSSDWI